MNKTILHKQSLFDVLLQHTGSLDSILDVAIANGLSVTSILQPGDSLEIPAGMNANKDILNYYTAKEIQPATAIEVSTDVKLEGISIWAVNQDFIVQ